MKKGITKNVKLINGHNDEKLKIYPCDQEPDKQVPCCHLYSALYT